MLVSKLGPDRLVWSMAIVDENENQGDKMNIKVEKLGKCLKVSIFWLQLFGDLRMTKNNKPSTKHCYEKKLTYKLLCLFLGTNLNVTTTLDNTFWKLVWMT